MHEKWDDSYWLDETSCSFGIKDLCVMSCMFFHTTHFSHIQSSLNTQYMCVCVCVCVYIYVPINFSMAEPSSSMTVGCFLATCKYYNT